jgi:lipopolysaccharide transport system ATP-binding protein
MSDIAVRVDGLGKAYRIGRREPYKTLRESLESAFAAPFRALKRRGMREHPETVLWALKDVSFDIKRGEAVGIIGRNGAGKSTLLKVLSRIVTPTEGAVVLDGRIGSLLEVGTGFHPELTGRENIFLNGAILGMRRAEVKRKFDEIVAFAETEKFIDTPVKRYSSGMYMRLAFAVAAHMETDILIVDEVLAVGDMEFQKKCLGKMGEVSSKEGRTVLFVSHQMGAIAQICGRAILMEHGRIALEGETQRVIDQYVSRSNRAADDGYRAASVAGKDVVITEAHGLNSEDQRTPYFTHDDPIRIALTCQIARWVPGIQVGLSVRDMRERIVFRTETPLPETAPGDCRVMTATIPGHTLMPGSFIVTIFVHRPFVTILDLAVDALTVHVVDAGSRFASYEGKVDCGCVFVECAWTASPPQDTCPPNSAAPGAVALVQ